MEPTLTVHYKPGDGLSAYEESRCRQDLYLPEGIDGFPTMVFFHGGGLQSGSRNGMGNLAGRFCAAGIAVVAPDYRLHPNVTYPAYIDDAAAAVSRVLDDIEEHGGDPGRVFVSGHSAGGYLSAMVGLVERYLGTYGHSTSALAGVIPVSGQMVVHTTIRAERGLPRDVEIIDDAAPIHHARADAPPFLSITGEHDNEHRSDENMRFIDALMAAGHPDARFVEVAGRDHCSIIDLINTPDDPVAQLIEDFITGH